MMWTLQRCLLGTTEGSICPVRFNETPVGPFEGVVALHLKGFVSSPLKPQDTGPQNNYGELRLVQYNAEL